MWGRVYPAGAVKETCGAGFTPARGWKLVRTKGSHRQYKHSIKVGLVTIPGRMGDDLAIGTMNSILKQAGLKP
ncbi:MAG: type II toxin-antitoxin system HicA family toxin [Gammaproteobacteria bacterium]|nr:type II toxin-antitoxin system HicA family toxin [Gammaproteobacteria bacterium]